MGKALFLVKAVTNFKSIYSFIYFLQSLKKSKNILFLKTVKLNATPLIHLLKIKSNLCFKKCKNPHFLNLNSFTKKYLCMKQNKN